MSAIVVQARIGSSRLPRKVVAELGGRPLLAQLLRRLQGSTLMPRIVVATTDLPEDDVVVAVAESEGAVVFRGHSTDVLRRFRDAAAANDLERMARVSADSPFLDASSVDAVARVALDAGADIVQNHRRRGWPSGTAVEVFDRSCIERLSSSADDERLREHVTLYAYEHPAEFTTVWVPPPSGVEAPDLRLVVDTPEDLERARRIHALVDEQDGLGVPLADVVAACAGRIG